MNSTKIHNDRDRQGTPPAPSAKEVGLSYAPQLPVFDTTQLFGTTSEIGIVHHGSLYRLKITRQGKLILNK